MIKNKKKFICPFCESDKVQPDEEPTGCYYCTICDSIWSENEKEWWSVMQEGNIVD